MTLHWKRQADDIALKLLRTRIDDIALQANTSTQVESLLHIQEFLCFNLKEDISTQNGGSLKLVDKFTYVRNSVSSTENDINTRLANVWTAIDRLSVIWKSDLSDEIKRNFSKQRPCPYYCMDAPLGH